MFDIIFTYFDKFYVVFLSPAYASLFYYKNNLMSQDGIQNEFSLYEPLFVSSRDQNNQTPSI